MLVVEIIKTFEGELSSGGKLKLLAGHRYVCAEMFESQMRKIYPDAIGNKESFDKKYYKEYKGEDLTGKTFFCWRTGGIGDILFMLPALHILKTKYPDCHVIVSSADPNHLMFTNNPDINEVYTMPFDFEIAQRADYHLTFQQIIEENPRASVISAHDLFLEKFGFDWQNIPENLKVPKIYLTDEEKKFRDMFLMNNGFGGKYKIGFQIHASSPIRTFPLRRGIDLVEQILEDKDTSIILFGGPKDEEFHVQVIEALHKNNPDCDGRVCSSAINKFNLRDTASVVSGLDLIIGPDSSLMHIAGAFGVPSIGIYGPFPSKLRMQYYRRSIGLDCRVACAPCFTHGNNSCYKSITNGESPCFTVLSNKTILDAVNLQKFIDTKEMLESKFIVKYSEFSKIKDKVTEYLTGTGMDVGSGFVQNYAGIEKIFSLDINPLMNASALGNAENLSQNIIPDSFDYAVLSFVLNCAKNWLTVLQEVVKVVKLGGYIIIYNPMVGRYLEPDVESFRKYMHYAYVPKESIEEFFGDKSKYELVKYYEPPVEVFDESKMATQEYGELFVYKIIEKI